MTPGLFDVPWFLWSGLAAALAALFAVVQIPRQTPHTVGITHFALRWFHSVTWLLLALSFLLRGLASAPPALASLVGVAGLGTYNTFQIALNHSRRTIAIDRRKQSGSGVIANCVAYRESFSDSLLTVIPVSRTRAGANRRRRCRDKCRPLPKNVLGGLLPT